MSAVAKDFESMTGLSRREFLRQLRAMGGLLLVADGLRIAKAADAPKYGAEGMEHGTVDNPLVFLTVGDDGWVTIVAHRSEMGQGVRTGMPLIVADELEADWSRVRVQQAPADEEKYGNQDTDGSRSTRHFIDPMRRCGAAARMMLEQAAALSWNVPVVEVRALNHEVLHRKTGRKLSYGALAKKAAKLPVPAASALRLKTSDEFRYVGKGGVPIVDGHDIVTGNAQYGIDPWFKDMSFAVIARSPVLGGSVKQFDGNAAAAAPGVRKVLQMPAPVAKPPFIRWPASRSSPIPRVRRSPRANCSRSSGMTAPMAATIPTIIVLRCRRRPASPARWYASRATWRQHSSPPPRQSRRSTTSRILPMRPWNRRAGWLASSPAGSRSGRPPKHRKSRARMSRSISGSPAENVTVHVTLLGGGFGRKSMPDFAIEAALLSQAMDGRPVKVTWTREDDLHHDFLHTVSVEYMKAGVGADGKVSAWLHRSVAPSLATSFAPNVNHEVGAELGMGFINMPYDIPNLRLENPEAAAHCRIGWFRSVSNIPHAFAVQSFVSELAASADKDHRDYLLELIGPARKIDPDSLQDHWNHGESPQRYPVDTGRLRRVVETVTQEAGWGRKFPTAAAG